MADSVTFAINIIKKIDDKELEKIKKELQAEMKKEKSSVSKSKTIKKVKKEKSAASKSKTVKKVKKEKSAALKSETSEEVKKETKIKRKKLKLTSSSSPIAPSSEQRQGGGIYGRVDPGVKGFKGRKGIGGGVQKQRDDRSKAAHSQKFFRDMIGDIEKGIKKNTISSKAIEEIIQNHMASFVKGSQLLSNPHGFIGEELLKNMKGIGAYGGPIVAAIIAIIAAPEVAKTFIKVLSQKGLLLNRDWERIIENEINGLFNIEEKKKRLLGIDGFVITQTDRYQPESGSTTYNSLENKDEVIISKIGLAEKAVGIE